MASPFTAALWTFGRRAFGTLPGLAFTIFVIVLYGALLPIAVWQRHRPDDLVPLFLFAAPIGAIAFHLKQMIMDARSRLLPGALYWQLRAGAALLMACLCLALLILASGTYALLPAIAISFLWSAAVFHCVVYNPAIVPLMLFIPFLTGATDLFSRAWTWLIQTPIAPWGLFALAFAWFVVAFWQLFRLREAAPSSQVRDPYSQPSSSESALRLWSNPARARSLAIWSPSGRAVRAAIAAQRKAGLFQRSRRWDVGSRTWPLVLVMGLMMCGLSLVASKWITGLSPAFLFFPLMFSMAFTAQQSQVFWSHRTIDILKPVTREQFILELGTRFGIELLRNVLLMMALLTVLILLLQRPLLPAFDYAIAASSVLLLTVYSFGSYVWVFRYRGQFILTLPIMVWCIPAMLICVGTAEIRPSYRLLYLLPIGFGISAILALIGVYLARDAYRRWLVADLG